MFKAGFPQAVVIANAENRGFVGSLPLIATDENSRLLTEANTAIYSPKLRGWDGGLRPIAISTCSPCLQSDNERMRFMLKLSVGQM